MKTPAFQFYPDTWLASQRVTLLTLEEEGAYIRLIGFCWIHGSIPADPEQCARLVGKGASTTLCANVLKMFIPSTEQPCRMIHDRLESERQKQLRWKSKSSEGGRKSAIIRRKRQVKGGSRVVDKCYTPNGNIPSPSPSPSPSKNTEDSPSPKAPPSSSHQAFIAGWSQNYATAFGFAYEFDGGRDGRAVKELLRMQIQSIDLLEIAKLAWHRGGVAPKSFVCQKASTIHGFKDNLNEIRTELKNGNQPYQRVNQRLNGVARSGIDYGEAAKRKLERQALEAKNGTAPHPAGT